MFGCELQVSVLARRKRQRLGRPQAHYANVMCRYFNGGDCRFDDARRMRDDFIGLWDFYFTVFGQHTGARQYVIVFTGIGDF